MTTLAVRRRLGKVCWRCVRPPVRGHGYCRRCRAYMNAYIKRRRAALLSRGRCQLCGDRRGRDGTTLKCRRCADKDRNRRAISKEASR